MSRGPKTNPPPDFDAAVDGYKMFTAFEPRRVGTFEGLVIPETINVVGWGRSILYRSDKWEKKFHHYIHEFGKNVNVGLVGERGRKVRVPHIFSVGTLYKLGTCQGIGLSSGDDEGDVQYTKPYPELYGTPNHRGLLVIDVAEDRARLIALIWGGNMEIKGVGIVQ
jgi:hypothetical protein